jgi:tetratricopeptide (TPR) repeat protein
MKPLLAILGAATTVTVCGCLWDARTLRDEKKNHPDLASIILNAGKPKPADPTIRRDIDRLRARPEPDHVDWINNLAGAYIRAGESAEAVKLLEPARTRFPDNYGVHANLGTAYHLLGRYAEAEKEIAKDLEINPDAHFGLEKFHLALLQYLKRDQTYQRRHLYIDEWTESFLTYRGEHLRGWLPINADILPANHKPDTREQIEHYKKTAEPSWKARFVNEKVFSDAIEAGGDTPPAYRFKWNLAADTNLVRGVMYMAELNANQPAAMVATGILAIRERAYNLAIVAFERAINLNSPQIDLLRAHIASLDQHIRLSKRNSRQGLGLTLAAIVGLPILGLILWRRAISA